MLILPLKWWLRIAVAIPLFSEQKTQKNSYSEVGNVKRVQAKLRLRTYGLMRAWVHLNLGCQPRGEINQRQRSTGVWAPAGTLACTSAFSLSCDDGGQDGGGVPGTSKMPEEVFDSWCLIQDSAGGSGLSKVSLLQLKSLNI